MFTILGMNTRNLIALSLLTLCTRAAFAQEAAPPATAPSTPRPATTPDPTIQKITAAISEQHVHDTIAKLESFETRNTLSTTTQPSRGIGAARDWIFSQFQSYSPRLQVSFDTHTIPRAGRVWRDVELKNVVAMLPGKSEQARNRWIIVSGHYDTVNLRAQTGRSPAEAADAIAPGACDDGSGTACVMECARVLSQYEFDATLVFVAFAGEEQGLVGAKAMAKRLKAQNQEIEAVLNNDIIGTDASANGAKAGNHVLVFSEDPNDSPSRQIARFVHHTALTYFPEMSADMVFRYDRFGRGGDHTAFNQEGYPAVRITTPAENFANQHTATDTLANMSVPYTTKVIRINAASAAALALAPKAPVTMAPAGAGRGSATTRGAARGTTADAPATAPDAETASARGRGAAGRIGLTRGAGYDAVLRWEYPNPEADLAGFVVVVRSTIAPDWEKEYWAGDVRTFTLKDLPIDQVVLGVKAVDKDGHEGPVSAYVNPPRAESAN